MMQADKMTSDELLSNTINYLRFPLCVLIVFLHFNLTGGLGIQGVKHGIDNPDWYFFIIRLVSETLGGLCVPLFFFISGYLFFYRNDFNGEVYKKKLFSRAKTLLIPYVLWNFIALIWKLKRFLPVVSSYYQPAEIHFSIIRLINTFFCYNDSNGIVVSSSLSETSLAIYPINGPLWYVRELMIMVILSPVIFKSIKTMRMWFVITLGLVWFLLPVRFHGDSYARLFTIAAFFFSWGAFYSIIKTDIVGLFKRSHYLPVLYLIIVVTDIFTRDKNYNMLFNNTGIILGIASAFIIASYLLEYCFCKVRSQLANSAFFVFALHQLFLGDVGRFLFIMLDIPENNPYVMISFYFLVPVFTIMMCLSIYFLLKRYAALFLNLLTGGR